MKTATRRAFWTFFPLSVLALGAIPSATASPINWSAPVTIAGDADVYTNGTLVYAYNQSGAATTVNGVPFAGVNNVVVWGGGNVTLSGFTGTSPTAFGSGTGAPWTGLSVDYRNTLKGAVYSSTMTTGTVAMVTLRNLTPGKFYVVQLWAHDNRAGATATRYETVTGGGNTVTLYYNDTKLAGGVGQYTLGTFTADFPSQTIVLTGNASAQVNALQVREVDMTGYGFWTGLGGPTLDAATTANFADNLFTDPLVLATFDAAKAARGAISFPDVYWDNGDSYAVTQPAITTAVGGVAADVVIFDHSSFNYSLASSDSIGLAGPGALLKMGIGNLTLHGANSYSGGTYVNGGRLRLGHDSALGSTNGPLMVSGGSVDLNGHMLAAGLFSGAGGTVTNSGTTPVTLSVGNNSLAVGVFQGDIGDHAGGGGTLSLVKDGPGIVGLAGTNTYAGATTVRAGVLSVASTNALPGWDIPGAYAVSNGAALAVGNSVEDTEVWTILGTGNFAAGAQLGFDTSDNHRTNGNILADTFAGPLGLAKVGASNLVLAVAHQHTGGTRILEGAVLADVADALGSGAVALGGLPSVAARLLIGNSLTFSNSFVVSTNLGTLGLGMIKPVGAWNAELTGPIVIDGGPLHGSIFEGNGAGILTVSGPITSTIPVSARNNVTISGGGLYSNFWVHAGMVRLGAENALCTQAVVDVAGNGTAHFNLNGFNQEIAGLTKLTGNGGTVTNGIDGVKTLAINVSGTNSYTYGGAVNYFVSLTKLGTGTQVLTGAGTYSGGTAVREGVLTVTAAGSLGSGAVTNDAVLNLFAGAVTYTALTNPAAGTLAGAGTNNVTVTTGSGSTILNGNYADFTGVWNIGVNAVPGAGKIQCNGADNAATVFNILTNATIFANSATPKTATAVLYGGDTGEVYGQLRLDANALWSGPVTLAGEITTANDGFIGSYSGGGTISGSIGETGGPRVLSKVGSQPIFLASANTYSGGTDIRVGYLRADHSDALGTGPVNVGALVTAAGRLLLGNGVNITNAINVLTNAGTVGYGMIKPGGAYNATISGPVNITGSPAGGGIFEGNGAGILYVAGPVTSSVPVTMRNSTTEFSGGGSYGSFLLQQGTVQLGADDGLATNAVLNVAVSAAGTFNLNGRNQALAGLVRSSGNAAVVTNTDAAEKTLTLNVDGAGAYAYAGVIAGPVALVKDGSGAQELSGTNAYSGITQVNAGLLLVNGDQSSSPGPVGVAAGGTLGGTGTLGGAVAVLGTLAPGNSVGTLTAAGAVFGATGRFLVEAGGLEADQLALSGSPAVTITNGAVLELSGAPDPGATSYTILSGAGSVAGWFFADNGAPLMHNASLAPAGWPGWYIQYQPTSIVLSLVPASGLSITNFAVRKEAGGVTVRWQTSAEGTATNFVVRRWDGANWITLNGAGTPATGAPGSYSFVDATATAGMQYFYEIVADLNGGGIDPQTYQRIAEQDLVFNAMTAAAPSGFALQWQSEATRIYRVSVNLDLMTTNWVPVATNLPANPPLNQWTDPTATNRAVYRIEVEP